MWIRYNYTLGTPIRNHPDNFTVFSIFSDMSQLFETFTVNYTTNGSSFPYEFVEGYVDLARKHILIITPVRDPTFPYTF